MKHNVVIMVGGKPVEATLRIGADEDDDAVDVLPCEYTYSETDEMIPVVEEE